MLTTQLRALCLRVTSVSPGDGPQLWTSWRPPAHSPCRRCRAAALVAEQIGDPGKPVIALRPAEGLVLKQHLKPGWRRVYLEMASEFDPAIPARGRRRPNGIDHPRRNPLCHREHARNRGLIDGKRRHHDVAAIIQPHEAFGKPGALDKGKIGAKAVLLALGENDFPIAERFDDRADGPPISWATRSRR